MKKTKFKEYVHKKILLSAFEYLKSIQATHNKVKNILYTKLHTAPYLIDSKFSIYEKLLLFKLRTRMVDVKCNFSNGLDDISCDLCDKNIAKRCTRRPLVHFGTL